VSLNRLSRLALICTGCAIAIIAGSILTLFLALAVSNDGEIRKSLDEAFRRGVLTEEFIPVSPYGHAAHTYDMYTECVALGTNFMNPGTDIVQRIAASPTLAIFGKPCEKLHAAVESGDAPLEESYLRFWHGYQVYMRPVLSHLSVEKYRQITAVLLLAVMAFFASMLARTFGVAAWPAALLPFFLIGDFLSVPIITSHAVSLIWIFLSVALVQVLLERYRDARQWLLPAFVFSAGMVTNFVSFLTNPPLAPALIGFLVIAHGTGGSRRQAVGSTVYAFGMIALWYLGYGIEWAAKWLLAAVVMGPDVVINDILGRIDLYEVDKAKMGAGLFEATIRNLAPNPPFAAAIVLSVLAAGGMIAFAAIRRRISRQQVVDFALMMTPLISIIAWIELNASHSLIHTGFVSRSMLLFSVLPLLAALLTLKRSDPRAVAEPV